MEEGETASRGRGLEVGVGESGGVGTVVGLNAVVGVNAGVGVGPQPLTINMLSDSVSNAKRTMVRSIWDRQEKLNMGYLTKQFS